MVGCVAVLARTLSGFRRVSVYPGKHGEGDKRVEFNGAAPTHSETVYMLGHKALAERRYRSNGHDWLKYYALAAMEATSEGEILRIANIVDQSIKGRRFVPITPS